MSKDLNFVVVLGRLVRDPEIRYTPNGTPVANFSVANGERFKQNNEWKDYTNYFDIVVWGNQAVNCEKFLKKGHQVAVEGSLRQNRWNDQATNQTRSKVEIIANSIQFLTPPSQQGQGAANAQPSSGYSAPQQSAKPVQSSSPQQSAPGGFIPDPWGDPTRDFGDSAGGQNYENDDDIPF